jgi:hypothetical protein
LSRRVDAACGRAVKPQLLEFEKIDAATCKA